MSERARALLFFALGTACLLPWVGPAAALAAGKDIAGFARGLQRAGYATDPTYANKIASIANGPTLGKVLSAIGDTVGGKVGGIVGNAIGNALRR